MANRVVQRMPYRRIFPCAEKNGGKEGLSLCAHARSHGLNVNSRRRRALCILAGSWTGCGVPGSVTARVLLVFYWRHSRCAFSEPGISSPTGEVDEF